MFLFFTTYVIPNTRYSNYAVRGNAISLSYSEQVANAIFSKCDACIIYFQIHMHFVPTVLHAVSSINALFKCILISHAISNLKHMLILATMLYTVSLSKHVC